ncbi:parallel beta-helix domain-containing protein [Leptospira sp. GIMC2001]|uniref:parallel beta-helix domain-containing protein n=1 Tax=Leptospira sp. GIMC2001 TaxID=1513297 RepID=UPI00234A9A5E|nr:parallel beta-helix domain-containing protein [Leptospira sp. GIMC2001]WCL50218.1 right-handed parallel beta-helix repeat-containing protein [Leptospira sp. GIMC2001]
MKNVNRKLLVIGTIVLLPILYITFLYLSRMEKRTDLVFPKTFSSSEIYCNDKQSKKLKFTPAQTKELQTVLNSLEECTTVELTAGTFVFNNSVSISSVNGITLKGAGKKATILKFVEAGNVNGVDVEASNSFTIRDLKILDSPKNGLEIRLSENIIIDNIEVTWSATSGEDMKKNGAYGVYPVNVVNVLLQNTDTFYASDAGLYVGQCINALVRYNRAEYNVMGLEIENTINADVYENIVTNNTGGFLAYDLNKNTIVSRNIRVYKNKIMNNNNPNFASTGIVKTVPAGIGMVLTSIRDIEIYDNEFGSNNSTDIGIVSGLVSETPNFSEWPMNNWRAYNIYLHDNSFGGGSGSAVDNGKTNVTDRPLGVLVKLVNDAVNTFNASKGLKPEPVPNIMYDGVEPGFTILAMTTWFGNNPGNHNNICLKNNNKGKEDPSIFDINLPALLNNSEDPTDESIKASVEAGYTRVYKISDTPSYGGSPNNGFDCEGFKFEGMPIEFPGT